MGKRGLSVFFKYFGGKGHISHLYPDPEYDLIIEPFAGGAAYSRRHYERDVVLVDAFPNVYLIWDWLINKVSREEILSLPLLEKGERLDDYSLTKEERMFLSYWVNMGSNRLRNNICGSWGEDWWNEIKRNDIANNLEKIRHWDVRFGDYREIPNVEATWFIDPPYEGYVKKDFYLNTEIDYLELGEWCKSRKGQVIVCEMWQGRWLDFVPVRGMHRVGASGFKGTSRAIEMIWHRDSNGVVNEGKVLPTVPNELFE